MAPPRLSDQQKRDRGTYQRSRSEAVLVRGRVALLEPLPPPSGLSAAGKRWWRVLMLQCIAARTLSATNLAAFQAMVETAVAREVVFRRALKEGPVMLTARGNTKSNASWVAFLATDAAYLRWADRFGLTPRGANALPQLPVPRGTRLTTVA